MNELHRRPDDAPEVWNRVLSVTLTYAPSYRAGQNGGMRKGS